MGIALVQEQRLTEFSRQLKLLLECAALRRARSQIAEIIKTAFTDRQHLGMRVQGVQFGHTIGGHFQRMMRMYASGGIKKSGVRLRQRQRLRRALAGGTGHHHLRNAGRTRTRQHCVQIVVEAFMAEVGADVDQFHTAIVPLQAHGKRSGERIQ